MSVYYEKQVISPGVSLGEFSLADEITSRSTFVASGRVGPPAVRYPGHIDRFRFRRHVHIHESPDAVFLPVSAEPPLAVGLPDRNCQGLVRTRAKVGFDNRYAIAFDHLVRSLPDSVEPVVIGIKVVGPPVFPGPGELTPARHR